MTDLVAQVKDLAKQAKLNVCQHRYGWDVYTRTNQTIFTGNLVETITFLREIVESNTSQDTQS